MPRILEIEENTIKIDIDGKQHDVTYIVTPFDVAMEASSCLAPIIGCEQHRVSAFLTAIAAQVPTLEHNNRYLKHFIQVSTL